MIYFRSRISLRFFQNFVSLNFFWRSDNNNKSERENNGEVCKWNEEDEG